MTSDAPDLGALFGASASDTFLGLEACPDPDLLRAPIALFGAPGATPYASVGAYCAAAPRALRDATAALTANLGRHNFDLGGPTFPDPDLRPVDLGDLPYDPQDFAANRAAIAQMTRAIRAKQAVPVMLGGDDSVPIPMLEALDTDGPLTILQIDAHIDWRDSHMDEPLGLSSTMRRASEMEHVMQIVQVGARSVGSAHSDDLTDAERWGARIVPARALHLHGVEAALNTIPEGANIAICFDVDALDPSIVPGVIGRAPGGLTYWQALELIEGAAARGRIVAADFVEYQPDADVDGLGALTVSRLITATLGILARQAAP